MAKKKVADMNEITKEAAKAVEPSVEDSLVENPKTPVQEEKPARKKILSINDEKPKKILGINKEKTEAKKETKEDKKAAPTETKRPTHSKKHQAASEKVEKNKAYPISEAVNLAKETSYTKFDGTLEVHINTNLKTLRGLVSLPYASGKKLVILAFGKGAEESGADQIGDEKKLGELEKGRINFDILVTTPEWMPRLARLAKTLGPRGLMPNPKNGTVTDNLKKAVEELQAGKIEYKTEKVGGVMHLSLGKLSQPNEELEQNLKTLLSAIGKTKIKKAVVTPTMGPGIRVDVSSI
jgi:large subunit ribosomal protein L1